MGANIERVNMLIALELVGKASFSQITTVCYVMSHTTKLFACEGMVESVAPCENLFITHLLCHTLMLFAAPISRSINNIL